MKAIIGAVVLAAAFAFAILIVVAAWKRPSHDRAWTPYLARLSGVDLYGDGFRIEHISDWTYPTKVLPQANWRSDNYMIADLDRIWLAVEPFPAMPTLMGHTLLIFQFRGGRLLGLTIEARKEANENYSVFAGALNKFELIYLWGTARDFLTRRAVFLDHEIEIYPLSLTQTEREQILQTLLERTIDVESKPRFYNTLRSNCTNELAKATSLPWSSAYVLTGRAAKHLHEKGYIPGGSDFPEIRSRAQSTKAIIERSELGAAAFDRSLTDWLGMRWSEGSEQEIQTDSTKTIKGESIDGQ
ncbi:MAG: DUF4105 domain-containing protein [Pseudomonadota bacterium]